MKGKENKSKIAAKSAVEAGGLEVRCARQRTWAGHVSKEEKETPWADRD